MSHSPAVRHSSPPTYGFTPRMQDAQARNKDPYALSSDSESGSSGRFDDYGEEHYEAIRLRREAAVILDNPELLMMHAQSRNETIPATRYHFTKQLCGYLEPAERSRSDAGPGASTTLKRPGGKAKKPAAPASASASTSTSRAGPGAAAGTDEDTAMADAEASEAGSGSAGVGPSGVGGADDEEEEDEEEDEMN